MTAAEPLMRGTFTFLFSDIEGSTRLEARIGRERYAELRERHRALLRDVWEANDGQEEGTEGDSFFVAFREAPMAIAAAVAGQRALAAEPWPDDAPIRVRMGINSGGAERIVDRTGRAATWSVSRSTGRPVWRLSPTVARSWRRARPRPC